jgi:hypothetical protein
MHAPHTHPTHPLAHSPTPAHSRTLAWQVYPYLLSEQYFKVKGLGFYQGDQNAGCGGAPQIDYYYCALPSLIADFRARLQWGSPPCPLARCCWQPGPPTPPTSRRSVWR